MKDEKTTRKQTQVTGGHRDAAPPSSRVLAEPGRIVAGRWRLDERIGRGGSGVVFRATNVSAKPLTRPGRCPTIPPGGVAAVKLAGRKLTKSEILRFKWEPDRISEVDSPGVLHPIDTGADVDLGQFFAMEFLSGKTVSEHFEEVTATAGWMSPEAICDIAMETLKVLHAAHGKHIVHRDIKPSNLFLCDDGSFKVLDFGVAKVADHALTVVGDVLGTPGFFAPEQARGESKNSDGRTDIWGVGATMFYLATKITVFEGDDGEEIRRRTAWEDPPSVGSYRSDLPEWFIHAVDAALQPAREERWRDAGQMLRYLSSYAAG